MATATYCALLGAGLARWSFRCRGAIGSPSIAHVSSLTFGRRRPLCGSARALAADGSTPPPATWQAGLDVQPGTVLRVRDFPFASSGASVELLKGENPERVEFTCTVASEAIPGVEPSGPVVDVLVGGIQDALAALERLSREGGGGEVDGGGSAAEVLVGRVPSRYTSLDVRVGGSVRVEGVQEAGLLVRTRGGDVDVGVTKATEASVETSGGSVAGALTAATASVSTGGGKADMARLAGLVVRLETSGGRVEVGAVYADAADIDSGGGDVSLANARCGEALRVQTGGGALSIRSLEGAAVLRTAGGRAVVHVQDGSTAVDVVTEGGDVSLTISPSSGAQVLVRAGDLDAPGAAVSRSASGALLRFEGAGGAVPSASRVSHGAPPSPPLVAVDAGTGRVSVACLSWVDLMREKLERPGERG